MDREKVKQFFSDMQKQFNGEYVIDLASLKDAARNIVPLLEGYEDTQPYAAWLKARLDYLDVADEFRRTHSAAERSPGPAATAGYQPGAENGAGDLGQEARRSALAGQRQALRPPPENDLYGAEGAARTGLDCGGGILL